MCLEGFQLLSNTKYFRFILLVGFPIKYIQLPVVQDSWHQGWTNNYQN